ncbi:6-phosphogluconate dehydrogenase [Pseudoloma neurophilia]|uniref:phosphogluconate dehydrogenase (NADP(+)-dependent, decarboxylating) n=1 Tax=Pseudoloma neurophilia TaxID=146866 RepID=A0A0R0LUR2_9MICR|nr:6-phosphogluconate dehydrogenase [Pseudoloma neurophilia]
MPLKMTPELSKNKMHVGVLGLAAMGNNLCFNLVSNGYTVSIYNRTPDRTEKIRNEYDQYGKYPGKFVYCYSLEEFIQSIPEPRPIFLIVMSTAVRSVIESILPLISEKDMICDFANSVPEHTNEHAKLISDFFFPCNSKNEKLNCQHSDQGNVHKARFLGIGISGGTTGARKNGGLMISGHLETYEHLKHVFNSLTNSSAYFGQDYATGHFIKFLHNGVEYALMSIISEFNEISCSIEKHYDVKKENSNTSVILEEINQKLDTYLLTILKKVTSNPNFKNIDNDLRMKGSGQWVYNTFGGRVNIGLIGNAVEQRVRKYFDNSVANSNDQIIKSQMLNDMLKDKNLVQMKSILKNALLYSLRQCYQQGIDMILHDNIIVKSEDKNFLIIKSLDVWRNGCIISGHIVDIVKDSYLLKNNLIKNTELEEYFKIDESTIHENLKFLTEYALENLIPVQQIPTILNGLNYKNDNQIRILSGMRDYFGAHGVYINGKWQNIDWE